MTSTRAPLAVLSVLGILLAVPASAGPAAQVHHRFLLSDFSGAVPYSGGRIVADDARDEVYVVASNTVRVFNAAGMETYSFHGAPGIGLVGDLTLDSDGNILLLSHDSETAAGYRITQCDYRGAPKREIELTHLPAELDGFHPDRIFFRNERLFAVSRAQRLVAVATPGGRFQRAHDLTALIDTPGKKTSGAEIAGFSVDPVGNMLFTVPTLFRAFVVSPHGDAASFGQPGSATGKFSVVAGIAGDGRGHYFVADKGRGVVLIFGENRDFVTEFGLSEDRRYGLLRPSEVAWDDSGRLYVTQMGNRGIAAFSVSFQ